MRASKLLRGLTLATTEEEKSDKGGNDKSSEDGEEATGLELEDEALKTEA